MATRLFVGNLPNNIGENELRSAFTNYGDVTNLDLKCKSASSEKSKNFAFVTISGSNCDIESCIRHFTNEDFNGNRLYVTRARESFLERLQKERLEAQQKEAEKAKTQTPPKKTSLIKEKSSLQKKKIDHYKPDHTLLAKQISSNKVFEHTDRKTDDVDIKTKGTTLETYKKKQDSDLKRMEAMKKKRQEFKEKQKIVKTGLTSVDKKPNKKIRFSDNEEDVPPVNGHEKRINQHTKNILFNDDDDDDKDSGDDVNFEIKKQFEGKKGQKVLDLQSRYKSDKRFLLDERFIEDEKDGNDLDKVDGEDQIEVTQTNEKDKQLDILQDVLGVAIKRKLPDDQTDGKKKAKLGMLRFDPSQPEHAKFLAPVEDTKLETTKKSKKKKGKPEEPVVAQEQIEEPPRPEVSKEQFYKVSETLKEAIAQPTSFSLRSLFGTSHVVQESKDVASFIPLEAPKKRKVNNPLEPGEKNPFIYDSSDSETEEIETETKPESKPVVTENKAVWRESFFFTADDRRLEEGIAFCLNTNDSAEKERRELKSLVKKRIYNKERKDQKQMFKKQIGGRKKTMKKSFQRR